MIQLVVANVLITPDNHILMGLRADRMEWEIPGGKVEDETLFEAYNRELLEETGMWTDDVPSLVGVSEPRIDGRRYLILFLLAHSWHGFPQRLEPEKCLAWRWFPLDGLPPTEKCTPGTRDFINRILPNLSRYEHETNAG